jgi:lipocalin
VTKKTLLLSIGALSVLLLGAGASEPEGLGPLQTVAAVDIQRCLGRWYEIARTQGYDLSGLYKVPQKAR